MSDELRRRMRGMCSHFSHPPVNPNELFGVNIPGLEPWDDDPDEVPTWRIWIDPDPNLEKDDRPPQATPIVPEPDAAIREDVSDDDRPLEMLTLPTARNIKLPGWSSSMTLSERMKAETPPGELNAKQIMTLQGWRAKLDLLEDSSAFRTKVKDMNPKDLRQAMQDQFGKGGGFKEKYLSALNAFID